MESPNHEKSIKTIVFSMVFANFQKIDVFEKRQKKSWISHPFSEVKTIINDETIVWKSMFFLNVDF